MQKLLRWIWIIIPIGFYQYVEKTVNSETPESNFLLWIVFLSVVASKLIGYAITDRYVGNRARIAFSAMFMQSFFLSAILLLSSFFSIGEEMVIQIVFGAMVSCIVLAIVWIHKINVDEDEEIEDEE